MNSLKKTKIIANGKTNEMEMRMHGYTIYTNSLSEKTQFFYMKE